MEKRGLIDSIIDLLYPVRCFLCGRVSRDVICKECISEFKKIESPICIKCGIPFNSKEISDHLCGKCSVEKRFFDSVRSYGSYEGKFLEAIHKFKYNRITSLSKPLGKLLVNGFYKDKKFDLIIPVPLHPKRLRYREFNQSLLIAKEIGNKLNIEMDCYNLIRIRDTEPQINLSKNARQKNVKGAFMVKNRRGIENKKILLIDDVYTTGATINECSKVLKKAGALNVCALTLARVV
jgi:ComF family protein